jgi:hypothetical protein
MPTVAASRSLRRAQGLGKTTANFVLAVRAAAAPFEQQGLITEAQYHEILSQAASSSCGKR